METSANKIEFRGCQCVIYFICHLKQKVFCLIVEKNNVNIILCMNVVVALEK